MIAADRPGATDGKLLAVGPDGRISHLIRSELAQLFDSGDVVVANDAATLPAGLVGRHLPTGQPIEIRLAAFVKADDLTRFMAIAFGDGDHRIPTEHRPPPPVLAPGDRLELGPLVAIVEAVDDRPRLVRLRFVGGRTGVLAGIAAHGRPIQYAHVPEPLALWDVWTNLAARPFAFETPSAGLAIDWHTSITWRQRGIEVVTLTHAAGLSSTGDPDLDARLPFDELYDIPNHTACRINRARAEERRIIAIGTTVVRALESASSLNGVVAPGSGRARGRIGPETVLRVVDTVLTGMHAPGESHFELLRAFADDAVLLASSGAATNHHYRSHEFGDWMLLDRQPTTTRSAAGLRAA